MDDDSNSNKQSDEIVVTALGLAIGLVVIVPVVGAMIPIMGSYAEYSGADGSTFESCSELNNTCEEVLVESQQDTVSEIRSNVFDTEQLEQPSIIIAYQIPTTIEKDYIHVQITGETQNGTDIINATRAIQTDESVQIKTHELSEEEQALLATYSIQIRGASDNKYAYQKQYAQQAKA